MPHQEGVKYAVRLRNYGSRTANGDGGMTTVQCSDGVAFTFSTCSLSSNGTNQTRGQIPQILYYRYSTCTLRLQPGILSVSLCPSLGIFSILLSVSILLSIFLSLAVTYSWTLCL